MVPWLVVPGLVVALAAIFLVVHVSESERGETAKMARSSQRYQVLLSASSWVATEIPQLLALDAFAEVPPEFETYRPTADYLRDSSDWELLLSGLTSKESLAGPTAEDLRLVMQTPEDVLRVLRPLDPRTQDRLADGDQWFIDPGPYVVAERWVRQRLTEASANSAEAARALVRLVDQEPYWRSTEFVLAAVALAALAVVGGLFGVWRLSSATRRLGEDQAAANDEAARMRARVEQLRALIGAGRQMSATGDPDVVAALLVDEASRMFEPDLVVLSLLEPAGLEAVAFHGPVPPATVALHDGVVGRCAESGAASRMIVASDPLLPGATGPLSLLAVPLVLDGHVEGVLTIGTFGSDLFDQGDETVLGLVALMGSGALGVAERAETTLALALDDPLTGLGNRRRLDRDLGALPAASAERPVAFLMIDIDHFKRYNDRYGHPAGDELLRQVGDAIRASLRMGDVAYRFGGEEFSVLLPDADATIGHAVAERVRAGVSAILPPPGGTAVTVSVGVSSAAVAQPPDAIVTAADQALYSAKRAGRDRVVVAS